jgi:hypothetical protein
VHTAIAAILSSLSVEKGASLPSNMGGKPYITAVDLNAEIKRKFVEHNLIQIPFERETSKEILVSPKGGLVVTVSIEAQYTIISTLDGSSIVLQGVGDGFASGSAVASNIASTNALKNALLRTFLVTEQSTEDAAKEGPKEETSNRAVTQAKASAAPDIGALRIELVGLTGDQGGATRLGNELFKVAAGEPALWASDPGKIRELILHLKNKAAV